jgi:uncharacterized membrane protein YphA (DoxX/SURF4 family)
LRQKISWVDVALWVPTLFLVYVFARQGVAKFSDESGWARAFTVWHFPVWFRILIGSLETAAAVLLLFRRTASAGAAIIAVVMLGAMGTHVYWKHPEQVRSEVLPLMLSLLVLRGRWPHFARLVSRRHRGLA